MAIGLTKRGSLTSGSDATSYATGSFTPSANSLLVAVYDSDRTSADPTTPTVSGHGTWTLVDSLYWVTSAAGNPTNRGKLFIYALNTGASPGAAVVTFDHGATTHAGAEASVFELSGTDVASGVAQSFVQFVHSTVDDIGSSELSLTLAAAGNSANRPFMAVSTMGAFSFVPQTNWTAIDNLSHSTPDQTLYTEWRSDAFDTAAYLNYSSNVYRGGIAFEVKALSTVDVAVTPSTVVSVAAIPASTEAATAAITPTTIAATAAVPASTAAATAAITPTTVAATAALPAPTISAGGSVSLTATTVQIAASIPEAAMSTTAAITTTTVAASVAVEIPGMVIPTLKLVRRQPIVKSKAISRSYRW